MDALLRDPENPAWTKQQCWLLMEEKSDYAMPRSMEISGRVGYNIDSLFLDKQAANVTVLIHFVKSDECLPQLAQLGHRLAASHCDLSAI
jgi:hypothetical protein